MLQVGHTAIFKHKQDPKYLSYYINGAEIFQVQKGKYTTNKDRLCEQREPRSYPVVGQALQDLRCGLYIRKYLFSSMEKVLRLQKSVQFQGARVH